MGEYPGRPPIWKRQRLINGMRLRVRPGIPWRDMSEKGSRRGCAHTTCSDAGSGTAPGIGSSPRCRPERTPRV
ncbi:hypothetical protein ACQEV2_40900 [Streptomyces sp. CA-251387]|uniref:hypothetical protein n=1 Tax=Streptomyces sp. CA-251387 TaxID=3240064 RepID=UPI003D9019C3